jgi:hypothetical protein
MRAVQVDKAVLRSYDQFAGVRNQRKGGQRRSWLRQSARIEGPDIEGVPTITADAIMVPS